MRALISAVVVTLAVLLQLAVADRIAFPGGAGPNLVLLAVAALALATGPMAGSITGFCAGLALDVAPPAGHYVGQEALVFCLVGYACGLIATAPAKDGAAEGEHSALLEIGVTAAAAICGEAMAAALGKMLSDPRVSWAAAKHVLPVAIGYDVLLSPFALFAVAGLLRLAGVVTPRSNAPATVPHRGLWTPTPSAGAIRQVSGTGGSPRLRLSGHTRTEGWLSGHANGSPARPGLGKSAAGGREPRLRLGRGGPAVGGMPGSAFSGGAAQGARNKALNAGAAKVRFGGRRGEGVLSGGSSRLSSGSSRFPGAALSGRNGLNRLAGSRLGATLLGGSVFSRPGTSMFGRSSPLSGGSSLSDRSFLSGRSLLPGRSSLSGRSFLSGRGPFGSRPKSHSAAFGSHQPRFRRPGALTRLLHGVRRPDRPKRPGRRWLRASGLGSGANLGGGLGRKPGLRSPGRGWLGRSRTGLRPGAGRGHSTSLRKTAPRFGSGRGPARLRMRKARPQRNWRSSRRSGGFR